MLQRRMGCAIALALVALPHAARLAGQGAAGSYVLLPTSRLDVKTGKSGLFGFAGHEHLIRARLFEGQVEYDPARPEATTVRIVLRTDGLEVLTPPDTAEIRKVTAAMRRDVLHTDSFPEIILVSRGVTATAAGYRLVAEFTMHGQSREVTIPVSVVFRGDTLVATAAFALKQTDFGIRPFRGGPGGTVRVADEVKFTIDARALPAGRP
ncbi:MAG: YceI family protein [Gemmatimonadales bacterium]